MDTRPNTWGGPGKKATNTQKINYSKHMINLSKQEKGKIDLVLIDGRFRVACCLKCYDIIDDDCYIVFDNFLNRKQYHIVLVYFDIIEIQKIIEWLFLKRKKI